MATKKFCDICGRECASSGRYELVYKCVLRQDKQDICYECVERIKREIKNKKN